MEECGVGERGCTGKKRGVEGKAYRRGGLGGGDEGGG